MADKIVQMYASGDENYAHLDKAEVEKAVKIINEKRKWLDENCAIASKLEKTVNPTILSVQFLNEKKALEQGVNPILNRPKPKVEPPPKEEEGGEKEKAKEEKDPKSTKMEENGNSAADAVNGDQGQMELD